MLTKLGGSFKAVAALLAIVFIGATVTTMSIGVAYAGTCPGGYYNAAKQWVCPVQAGDPGSPGGTTPPPSSGGSEEPGSFTPPDPGCTEDLLDGTSKTVDCKTGDGQWVNSKQCYVKLEDPQNPPPAGDSAQVGAWYSCIPPAGCYAAPAPAGTPPITRECFGVDWWSNTPPPGINQYTPAQAAGLVVKLLVLSPPTIGMAPADKVHTDDPAGTAAYRRTWVGIPVWLWIGDQNKNNWGPQTVSATYGGVTVTATATAQAVTWNSGDGQSVTCGTGTAFDEAYWANKPATDSPSCGWRYQHTSADQPGGVYTVSATTSWIVNWSGGGQNGQIQMPTTQSTTTVKVGQLESVNTPVTSEELNE